MTYDRTWEKQAMILQQPYLNHKCIPEMYPQKSTLEVVYLVTALKMRSKFFSDLRDQLQQGIVHQVGP